MKRFMPNHSDILLGGLDFVDGPSTAYSYDEIFGRGIYDFQTNIVAPFIIDLGANIGLATIRFKTRFPDATVISFEPDPSIAAVFRRNVSFRKLSGVTLVEAAVAGMSGVRGFASDGADGGHLQEMDGISRLEQVRAMTLSSYLTQSVDLLKIDIEGAEVEVLEECQGLLDKVDRVFVEVHSLKAKPQQLHRILSILASRGFRVYLENLFDIPQPFLPRQINGPMDFQVNVWGWRE